MSSCKECEHFKVCEEIERLPCRKDFIWYRAESGCPHYKPDDVVEVRHIKLDEKWLRNLRDTAYFYSADIVCGAGTDWVLKTAEAENKTLFEVVSYLENAPSEDVVEVKHGRWIRKDYKPFGHDYFCSVCGYAVPQEYKYCPECATKMDRETETKTTQEALWEKNMELLRNGGFGSMAGNECFNTLLRYWQAQEQAGYPKASENVAYFRELVERNENGR